MPHAPAKPCCWPGCPELTTGRYCPTHQRQHDRDFTRYERDPHTRRRYGPEWANIRKLFLAQHPLCEMCQANGCTTPATEVHHKVPLANGGTHDWSNLAALCKSCHSSITIREARHRPSPYAQDGAR